MIDLRSLVRGVVLQALYELDSTRHPTEQVLPFNLDISLQWDDIHTLAYLAFRRRLEYTEAPAQKLFTLPLKKTVEQRTPVEQVLIDALTEGIGEEEISETDTAEIEILVEVPDMEDLDLKNPSAKDSLPLEYQQQALRWAKGVMQHRQALDDIIHQHAPEHPIAQIAIVDRNVLRLAIYEFAILQETPIRVAINEAVELAKIFGSDGSGRFVNGVLGAVFAERDKIIARLQPIGES